MASANKSLVLFELVTEMFNRSPTEFAKVCGFPFTPTLVTKKGVERRLIVFGLQVLRQISNYSKPILNRYQQIYFRILRQLLHRCHRHFGDSYWINKGNDECGSIKFQLA